MSELVSAPRELVERKPKHGAPCNRCGLCCMVKLCDLGQSVFKKVMGRCPALGFDGVEATCGLMTAPDMPEMREAAALLIAAGEGCTMRINGEPINKEFNDRLNKQDLDNAQRRKAARALWGML